MTDLAAQLEAAIDTGNAERCVELLRGLNERERRPLSSQSFAAYKATYAERWSDTAPPPRPAGSASIESRFMAACVAVAGACSLSQIKRLSFWMLPAEDLAFAVLADRDPTWVRELVEWMVDDSPGMARWTLALADAGLCAIPTRESFYMGLMDCWVRNFEKGPPIAERIRSRADFRDDHLWRLLVVEGGGEYSLAAADKYSLTGWADALVELADAGDLPRARLIDVTLDVLERDFAQFRAGWYSRFHERLAPTLEERVERVDRYLALLGSSIPPTVAFALKALKAIDKAKQLDPHVLVAHVRPAMDAKAKSTVTAAMRLVGNAVKREPTLAAEAGLVVTRALLHEKPDVQEAALEWLERWRVTDAPEIQTELELALESIAPSLRGRITALLTTPSPSSAAAHPDDGPRARDDRDFTVPPIESREDLVEQFAYVLENPADVVAIERVVAGLARLGAESDDGLTALAAPLLKRASKIVERDPDCRTLLDLAQLAVAWITGKDSIPTRQGYDGRWGWYGPSTEDLFGERLSALVTRLSTGQSVALLSEITHERGWTSPSEVVARALAHEAAGASTDVADQVLAILRLAPGGRDDALIAAAPLGGELGAAIRYALGSALETIGSQAALWVAAARARDPLVEHPDVAAVHGGLGAGSTGPGHCRPRVDTRSWEVGGSPRFMHDFAIEHDPVPEVEIGWELPTVLFHVGGSMRAKYSRSPTDGACGFDSASVRWGALVAPGCTEDYFEVGCQRLDLDWDEVQWEAYHFFEPLLAPDTRLGPWALRLMALGLGAKESGQHGMAIDACITSIDDGRLDAAALATEMGALFPTGIIKCGRWSKTLAEVAHAGPKHGSVVRTLLQGSLRGDPAEAPKDTAKLLELLHELCVDAETRVEDVEARAYIEGLSRGAKTAKLKKLLLAL